MGSRTFLQLTSWGCGTNQSTFEPKRARAGSAILAKTKASAGDAQPVPLALQEEPSTLNPKPSALSPQPQTLNPHRPFTIHPTPCTLHLHPAPDTPHPTLFTLHLTPYTLNPQPSTNTGSSDAQPVPFAFQEEQGRRVTAPAKPRTPPNPLYNACTLYTRL